MIDTRCIENKNERVCCVRENKSSLYIYNNRRVPISLVTVDGCAIHEGCRCDYLIKIDGKEHYIELKGKDIEHAFDQLISSIRRLSEVQKTSIYCYIITTRSPKETTSTQRKKKELKNHCDNSPVIKNRKHCVSIE